MIFTANSASPDETLKTGERLGRQLRGYEIILISGELGAGKTVLAKGIAAGLGIVPEEVVSPTFILMAVYDGRHRFFHFDLYRLGAAGMVEEPGIDEYIGEGVIVVEWAQYLPDGIYALEKPVEITLCATGPESRRIKMKTGREYIRL